MNNVSRAALAVGLCALWAVPARASFEISCSIANNPAMIHEAVRAQVRISNRSGRTVTVDPATSTRLRFIVERKPGYPLKPRKEVLPYEPFEIPPGATVDLDLNLKHFFTLIDTGPYTVRAMLLHQGRYHQSSRALFDIVPGFEVDAMDATAPGGGARRYILKTLARGRGQSLFIEINDPSRNLCYGVYDLGQTLSMQAPAMKLDRLGRIHILHQSGPTRYTHSVFGPDGQPVDQTYHTKGPGLPAMQSTDEGDIEVTGVVTYQGDTQSARPAIRPFNPFE